MKTTDWRGCYEGGWSDAIVPEAFAHPAKFSRSLIVRIIRHGLDQGYWKPGDLIGDPFGGVALGGIIAGYHGLNWLGVELEPRFVDLGNQNLAMHGPRWLALGEATSVKLVQGDSRRFAAIVGEVCGVVSSPPFVDQLPSHDNFTAPHDSTKRMAVDYDTAYGQTPGQIGSLPAGQLDAVVSSPPYAESIGNENNIDYSKAQDPNTSRRGSPARDSLGGPYGTAPGQIGALRCGAVDAVVTSPPFESSLANANASGVKPGIGSGAGKWQQNRSDRGMANLMADYGVTPGNVGNDSGETYWQAMRQVYSQMFLALKPGGISAIVVKDYVKDKARVPLCDQTCTLLNDLGFVVFERCRCWLVQRTEHPGLFGEAVVKTVERKSFFRRLAEKKGSPRIDFEETIWCVKR